jgi:hypothetical protein
VIVIVAATEGISSRLALCGCHIIAGITLSMKNLFGTTPNALYGDQAGREDATAGRGNLHDNVGWDGPDKGKKIDFPGAKKDDSKDAGYRIPRIIADLVATRPIHLAIIDGITSRSGGEGPWCESDRKIALTRPGVIITGLNPVSTDAVGAAVMGFDNPRMARGQWPFLIGDNHLVLAEQKGLGVADLKQIEVLGESLNKVRYPFYRA